MATEPLIVITGPTASGKTSLAIRLAQRFNGEIICADSRTVYKGLDIGTAKPTNAERAKVPHHLLDIVEPDQRFSLKDFQSLAFRAIDDIRSRGKIPFLVGGSGLYIDSVILNYQLSQPVDFDKRRELEKLEIKDLQELIRAHDYEMPENLLNKRQLIRTLERGGVNHRKLLTPDQNTIVVQITTANTNLEAQIAKRAEQIFEANVVKEAKAAASKYGWDNPAMTGNIYPIIRRLVNGEVTKEQAIEEFIRSDKRLVKKQLTWLRRHKFVQRLGLREAEDYIAGQIEHRLSV